MQQAECHAMPWQQLTADPLTRGSSSPSAPFPNRPPYRPPRPSTPQSHPSAQTCTGSGVKPGTQPSTCVSCQGTGQVVSAMRTPLGTFQQVTVCPRCEGAGQTFTPCDKCGGDGRVQETKRIALKVPPGVDAGSRLRVRGEGNSGRRGGQPGDLYVYISVKEHPELRRDGQTIHSDVDISYVDAILGTQVRACPREAAAAPGLVAWAGRCAPQHVPPPQGRALPKRSARCVHCVALGWKAGLFVRLEDRVWSGP